MAPLKSAHLLRPSLVRPCCLLFKIGRLILYWIQWTLIPGAAISSFPQRIAIASLVVRGDMFAFSLAAERSHFSPQAKNQTLGAATQYSSGFESNEFPADGLMGMGFQSISVYNASPPVQNLISQQELTEPMFGFKFAPSGSELFIGGVNNNLYTGKFTWVNLTHEVLYPHKYCV